MCSYTMNQSFMMCSYTMNQSFMMCSYTLHQGTREATGHQKAPSILLTLSKRLLFSGLGLSMSAMSCGVLIQQRFGKNRSLATGCAMMGAGLGSALVRGLNSSYGHTAGVVLSYFTLASF